MYLDHWPLTAPPFHDCVDPELYLATPVHEEALARLHFLVDERRRLGLLLGGGGCGKSIVMEMFASRMRQRRLPAALLTLAGSDPHTLVWELVDRLGVHPPTSESMLGLWRQLGDLVVANRYQRLNTVLLIDDADRAAPDVLDQVSRLVEFDPSSQSYLTIVLAASDEHYLKLGAPLLERAELRIDVYPLELEETIGYVESLLGRAGGSADMFSNDALARLHELAHGVPRRIHQLASLALVAGAGNGLAQIDTETIDSVYLELGVNDTVGA